MKRLFTWMALALFFVKGLDRLRDLGYDHDLVRDNAPSADKVATHFWLQVGSSGALTLLCAALVPVWRHVYPDRALLGPVIVALALGQLTASLGATPLLMLRKELGFGRVARIDLVKAFVKTAVVLALARAGVGVWALVAEHLLEALPGAQVGTIVMVQPVQPAGQGEDHEAAAALADAAFNRAFLDPLFGKGYPEPLDAMVEAGVVLRTAQNLMRDAGKCDPPVIERRRTERGWECRRASTTARPRKL